MRITVAQAAAMMNVSPQFVRLGLQRGVLPIGSAVKMSSRWTYHISEHLLNEYLGIKNAACAATQTADRHKGSIVAERTIKG